MDGFLHQASFVTGNWCYDRHCSVRLVICFDLAIDQIAQSGLSSLKVIYYSAQLFRLSNIAGRCNLFSKLLRPTTGDNSLYRFVLDVVHPVCGLERQRFDVLDLFGDDGLHHLAHRSAFHKIAELATDVLAVLPPNFLVLPG
ncbi:Uncharacterised protein [Shigella sonnei]|nr:Uncharacterised protein [Shigella sonnei]